MGKRAFFALLLAGFSSMLGLAIISPLLPAIAVEYGADGFWIGVIFTGFVVSSAVSMSVVGRLSDKVGRRIFITSGLLLYAVSSLLYLLARGVYSLTAVRLVHGFASGMIVPIVLAYAGDFAEAGREGRAMGVFNMVFFLGIGAGSFLGGILENIWGFRSVFYAMALISVASFFVAVFFIPAAKPHKSSEEKEGYLPFRTLVTYNSARAILLVTVVATLRGGVLFSFLPLFASGMQIGPSQVGILLCVITFLAGLLQPPFAHLTDKFGRSGKLYQLVGGAVLSTIAFSVVPFCSNYLTLLIACSVIGIGAAVSVPAAMGISVFIGKRVGMGHWMGIFNTTKSFGFIITPLIAGIIMDRTGIKSVFYVFTVLCFLGILVSYYYVWRRLQGYRQG